MSTSDTHASYWVAPEQVELWDETVGQMIDRVAAEHPDRDALVFHAPDTPPRHWTYRQFVADSRRVARALLEHFAPGENIAVWSPNRAEWVLLQHGAARAGLRLVTVNPAYLGGETSYVLRQSRAKGLFYMPSYRGVDLAAIVAEIAPELNELRTAVSFDDWETFLDSADANTALPDPRPEDGTMIQYTSGTTGAPKGVLLSHKGLVNGARLVAERAELETGAISINSMPLFHVGGCGTMELGTFSRAGTYVLAPGFDAAHVLQLIEIHRGTVTLAVPTMLIGLLEHPARTQRDLSSLRTMVTGGASVSAELVRRVKSTFGCRFTITFGQTETSGPAIQTSVRDSEVDQAETIGRPLPSMEARIVDLTSGKPVPFGTQGEIHMRGPLVMLEYFDRPEDTAQTIDSDGWLHSGDLGSMDERGFVTITGRSKDMINRGGEKIYPREIEDLLFQHDAISDVAVVGVPDEKWGEHVAAVVRLKPDVPAPSALQLRTYCEQNLARYKIPVEWFTVDTFPQTPSGKIQKFVLCEQINDKLLAELAPGEEDHDSGD